MVNDMKRFTKRRLSVPMVLSIVLATSPIPAGSAGQHRQHGAHLHGTGRLNLALDGRAIYVELESPAANIVGFEHTPASEAEHSAVDDAVAVLKDGDRLFRFNETAGCRLQDAKIASALIRTHHERHEHADAEAHEHNGEHEGEGHADFVASYHFECTRPERLEQLTIDVFSAFVGTQRLKVQFVLDDRQGAAELNASDHVVNF